jgi:hypothetical protein
MVAKPQHDERWMEVSASLRAGILYVKTPRRSLMALVHVLQHEKQDLFAKKINEVGGSVVLAGPTTDWIEDLIVLKALALDYVVTEFIEAIEAGLRNDLRVDWLSRVAGGPPREANDALTSPPDTRPRPV